MSVVRSAYRQILRVGARAQRRYEDPNDLCFAIFGILLNRNDFANGGYGASFAQIVCHCFERPGVAGVAGDTTSARLQASFSVLRRLNELTHGPTPHSVRQRRAAALDRNKDRAESFEAAAAAAGVGPDDAPATAATAAAEVETAAEEEDNDVEEDEEDEDDSVIVGTTTLFFERSHNRKVQQEVRHVVVSRVKEDFPPYAALLPPEPMYPLFARQELPFLLGKDAVTCIAATSRLLRQQQARREQDEEAELGYAPAAAAARAPTGGPDDAAVAPDGFPATPGGFAELLRSVPTRAVARTDFMEVEVCTQYICSNARSAPGAAAARLSPSPPQGLQGKAAVGSRDGQAHLFLYYVFIRNLSPSHNPKLWHAQVLSQHVTVLDVDCSEVVEMVRPGVVGNFPMLAPGESHVFESGTSQFSAEGILRGTIQVNAFNEEGQMRVMDVVLPPTRLSTTATDPPFEKGATARRVGRHPGTPSVTRMSAEDVDRPE